MQAYGGVTSVVIKTNGRRGKNNISGTEEIVVSESGKIGT